MRYLPLSDGDRSEMLRVIGAKSIAQLDDNLAATTLSLSDEERAKLDMVSALPSEYPGWMLERQAGSRVPKPFQPK